MVKMLLLHTHDVLLSACVAGAIKCKSARKNLTEELNRLWQAKEPVVILDVRTERSLEGTTLSARSGAIPPDM
jgi:hypothetical protein